MFTTRILLARKTSSKLLKLKTTDNANNIGNSIFQSIFLKKKNSLKQNFNENINEVKATLNIANKINISNKIKATSRKVDVKKKDILIETANKLSVASDATLVGAEPNDNSMQERLEAKATLQKLNKQTEIEEGWRDSNRVEVDKNLNNHNDATVDKENTYQNDAEDDKSLPLEVAEKDWYSGKVFHANKDFESEEEFIPKWKRNASRNKQADEIDEKITALSSTEELIAIVQNILLENRGFNITVIDVKFKTDFTQYLVICEGTSWRQLYNLCSNVKKQVRKFLLPDSPLIGEGFTIDGEDSSDWMCVDMGSIILHCFTPEARKHYDLEGLWNNIDEYNSSLETEDSSLDELLESGLKENTANDFSLQESKKSENLMKRINVKVKKTKQSNVYK
ncbi:hypothetical protein HK099_006386 [Clydaea vesicula]|uniref:Mitochondrial assembly of ribosomal large subunit protein 1 n=1 Tax=Clydaea vesicula TaxID=447962 RepID=A0AAD5TYC2_9FUNG|nr:hypothetical protein HK099_006386 [Clydaea vesicula]